MTGRVFLCPSSISPTTCHSQYWEPKSVLCVYELILSDFYVFSIPHVRETILYLSLSDLIHLA